MKDRRKSLPPARFSSLPAYGIAAASAAVLMAQGGVWAALVVFGLTILAAVIIEVYKQD
jgi:hypothetical protein